MTLAKSASFATLLKSFTASRRGSCTKTSHPEGRHRAHGQRIAIARSLRSRFGCDVAARARARIDRKGLAEFRRESLRDRPDDLIGRAACRRADGNSDWPGRPETSCALAAHGRADARRAKVIRRHMKTLPKAARKIGNGSILPDRREWCRRSVTNNTIVLMFGRRAASG